LRLASLRDGRDGQLIVVAADLRRAVAAPAGLNTLQQALDDWEHWEPHLEGLAGALESRSAGDAFALDPARLDAPLPRAYQWAESSSFLSHMERCRGARGAALPEGHGVDMVAYQTGSDWFLGPREDAPIHDTEWGLDIEPTVALITGDLEPGTSAAAALEQVRLIVILNDWTLRNLLPREFSKGVGFYQCKPYRTFAPVAVTPAALGPAWNGKQLVAEFQIFINGRLIGHPDAGSDMTFDFGRILEYMLVTRRIGAGSIIGCGTVSNHDPSRGIACLAELRATEIVAGREDLTPYLAPGDSVRIEALGADGTSLFGAMDQRIVAG
jgi:fumarylacetoacetate (FAA) hydrolase